MSTKFRTYFMQLSQSERDRYAEKAGTTALYIQAHLARVPPRKVPREKLMRRLAEASDGALTCEDLLDHFFRSQEEAA